MFFRYTRRNPDGPEVQGNRTISLDARRHFLPLRGVRVVEVFRRRTKSDLDGPFQTRSRFDECRCVVTESRPVRPDHKVRAILVIGYLFRLPPKDDRGVATSAYPGFRLVRVSSYFYYRLAAMCCGRNRRRGGEGGGREEQKILFEK